MGQTREISYIQLVPTDRRTCAGTYPVALESISRCNHSVTTVKLCYLTQVAGVTFRPAVDSLANRGDNLDRDETKL